MSPIFFYSTQRLQKIPFRKLAEVKPEGCKRKAWEGYKVSTLVESCNAVKKTCRVVCHSDKDRRFRYSSVDWVAPGYVEK